MLFFNKVKFVIKESLNGVFKNFSKSFIQFLVCFISLTFFSVVAGFYFNIQNLAKDMRNKIEISVFLQDNVSSSDVFTIEDKIKENPNVKSYSYVTKDQAQLNGRNMFDKSPEMLEAIEALDNPFPASFTIELKNADYTQQTAKELSSLSGIEKDGIKFGEEYMDKLLKLSNGLKYGSYVALGFFFVIAVFFMISIVNVILAMKEQECKIMFMIGASPLQIKFPFYIQGILMGLLSSAFAYYAFYYTYTMISKNIGYILLDITSFKYQLLQTVLITGCLTGTIATTIALTKFDKVSKKVIKKRKITIGK